MTDHLGESHLRRTLRVSMWRIDGILLGIVVGWIVTGSVRVGAEVSLLYNGIRLCSHWGIEYLWAHIPWGIKK